MKKWTMSGIMAANKAAGFHFFDRETMRHWQSRIEGGPYHTARGVLFITSEPFDQNGDRKFKIRRFDEETGRVHTDIELNSTVSTLAEAKALL